MTPVWRSSDAGEVSARDVDDEPFHAHVTRDGRFWLIHVPEIDRHTQARHLREIDTMARDLVAVMTGEDPAGIQLTIDIHTPGVAAAHLARAAELREESHGCSPPGTPSPAGCT